MKSNRPSSTALLVSQGIAALAFRTLGKRLGTHPLFQSIFQSNLKLLEDLALLPPAGKNPLSRFLFRAKMELLERLSIPGIYLHYLLRKAWIEQHLRRQIEKGVDRVLIFGAGMDTLSLRLKGSFPRLRIEEWDHPATQSVKKRWLRRHHPNLDIDFFETDLSRIRPAQAAFIRKRLSSGKRTLVVIEGVFMYLTVDQVRLFFRIFSVQKKKAPVFLFTTMMEKAPMNYQFKNASPFVNTWLRLKGEVFQWGLKSDQVGTFLQSVGLVAEDFADDTTLRAMLPKGLSPGIPKLAQGEVICLARGGHRVNG